MKSTVPKLASGFPCRSRSGTEQLAMQLLYPSLASKIHIGFILLLWGGDGPLIRVFRETERQQPFVFFEIRRLRLRIVFQHRALLVWL